MQLQTILQKLCCPFDKSELYLDPFLIDENDNIIEGVLSCTCCSRVYPIISGIPIMTPDEYREKSLEKPM